VKAELSTAGRPRGLRQESRAIDGKKA